ncbi:hypothetical protein ACFCWT_26575 [Streptomyces olivaceus]|uniref:hypothetical protein n=1 Tax=Streptomyces olivaceus TaxID=47716 RepID=UPI0035DE65EE
MQPVQLLVGAVYGDVYLVELRLRHGAQAAASCAIVASIAIRLVEVTTTFTAVSGRRPKCSCTGRCAVGTVSVMSAVRRRE